MIHLDYLMVLFNSDEGFFLSKHANSHIILFNIMETTSAHRPFLSLVCSQQICISSINNLVISNSIYILTLHHWLVIGFTQWDWEL